MESVLECPIEPEFEHLNIGFPENFWQHALHSSKFAITQFPALAKLKKQTFVPKKLCPKPWE
jgi:hypothetical protein